MIDIRLMIDHLMKLVFNIHSSYEEETSSDEDDFDEADYSFLLSLIRICTY